MTDIQKTIALTLVIGTVCILMAGVVFLPAFAHPIEAAPASAITTIFISMVTGVLASLGFSQINKAQTETALANLKAEDAQTQLNALTYSRGEALRPAQTMGIVAPHQTPPPPPPPIHPHETLAS